VNKQAITSLHLFICVHTCVLTKMLSLSGMAMASPECWPVSMKLAKRVASQLAASMKRNVMRCITYLLLCATFMYVGLRGYGWPVCVRGLG